jgi:hypothetical protein
LRRLTDDALSLNSVVAQQAISVLLAIEQQAKLETGKHLAPDAARLRAAAREGVYRRPKTPKKTSPKGDAPTNGATQANQAANPPAAPPGATQH